MNKKNLILTISIIYCILGTYAQNNYYYWYKENKVFLQLDKSKINIITNNSFSSVETSNIGIKSYTIEDDSNLPLNKFARAEFVNELNILEYYQKLNTIKNNTNVKGIGLYFKRTGAKSLGTSNYFYVKLKTVTDYSVLVQLCDEKDVQIVKQVPYMPLWYILSTTNCNFTSIELSNQFYESGQFADTDPAFIFEYNNTCKVSLHC